MGGRVQEGLSYGFLCNASTLLPRQNLGSSQVSLRASVAVGARGVALPGGIIPLRPIAAAVAFHPGAADLVECHGGDPSRSRTGQRAARQAAQQPGHTISRVLSFLLSRNGIL